MVEVHRHEVGNRRFYTVTGDPNLPEDTELPNVTTILNIIAKPALIDWSKKLALDYVRDNMFGGDDLDTVLARASEESNRVRDEAAAHGTAVHEAVANFLAAKSKDEGLIFTDFMYNIVSAFDSWITSMGLEIIAEEVPVYSSKYLYAGTLDAIGVNKETGTLVIMDWKTSNRLYPETALQVAAYAKAYEETFGVEIKEAYATRFGRDKAEFETKKVADLDSSFTSFLSALVLYKGTKADVWEKKVRRS
jgi:hypothetical protein